MSLEVDPEADLAVPTRGRRDGYSDLFMSLQRTADRLMQGLEDALKTTGITPVQYLVLRSLRESGSAGMPSNQIARNMTTHDPDMTRLLDKLQERGAITRWRDPDDRRIYRVKLTREGAILLRQLTQITRELHRKQFNTLDGRQVKGLTRTLATVNDAPIPIGKRRPDLDRRPADSKPRTQRTSFF